MLLLAFKKNSTPRADKFVFVFSFKQTIDYQQLFADFAKKSAPAKLKFNQRFMGLKNPYFGGFATNFALICMIFDGEGGRMPDFCKLVMRLQVKLNHF